MPNGVARTADFNDGSERVREPVFHVESDNKYRRTSVLDNLLPNPNGESHRDTQRKLMGGRGSGIGVSEDTFDKSLWLRGENPAPARMRNGGDQHG